jgi:hypothetical protein
LERASRLISPELLIRAASLLVPSRRREEWVREWLAELHYARGHAAEARVLAFAYGAFHDSVWQLRDFWTLERASRCAQSAPFCLGAIAAFVLAIVLGSGNLPMMRGVVMPLPYRDPATVATVAQAGTMAMRAGVRSQSVELWRENSLSLDGVATYSWQSDHVARVSRNFFSLLGERTVTGTSVDRDALSECAASPGPDPAECVIVGYEFWRGSNANSRVIIDGKSYRVAAVLAKGFWFLSPRIAVWRIGDPGPAERTGVVARLRGGFTRKEAEAELGIILRAAGMNDWESIVEINNLSDRVRSPLWSFAFGLILAIVIILPSVRLRMPTWNPRAAAFFAAKTALLLLVVLLCGIEFTHATSITMLGGTDTFTEPLSTWLFMLGSMGALGWSISDQRRRCRVCLRRLGMAAQVGCPGCLLLNWAGTELVCVEGHGMLHVPEMAACWQEPDRWTSLDNSWQGLFERG